MYKAGHSNIINRLWKECKKSFKIQPYNIIDISELSIREDIGRGSFGGVKKAIWNSPDGPIPVALKVIQENSQLFDLSDLRGEVRFVNIFIIFPNSLFL